MAYYRLGMYDRMKSVLSKIQKKIEDGNFIYKKTDFSVVPMIFEVELSTISGNFESALQKAKEAFMSLSQKFMHKENRYYRLWYIQLIGSTGLANAFQNQTRRAKNSISILNEIETKDKELLYEKYINIARIYIALSDYRRALRSLDELRMRIDQRSPDFSNIKPHDLYRLFMMCRCLYMNGRLQDAKVGYGSLLKYPLIDRYYSLYWMILFERGMIAKAEGRIGEATTYLSQAADVVELYRSGPNLDLLRTGSIKNKQQIYTNIITLLVEEEKFYDALQFVERSKQREIIDLLYEKKIPLTKNREIDRTIDKLNKLEHKVAQSNITEYPRVIADREKALKKIKRNLINTYPALAYLTTMSIPQIEKLQKLLSPAESIVEYYYSGNKLFGFVLTRGNVAGKKLDVENLKDRIDRWLSLIRKRDSSGQLILSKTLFRQLFKPLMVFIENKNIIIVPHGELFNLPFNALFSGYKYLIDHYQIRTLPTSSVLQYIEKSKPEIKKEDPLISISQSIKNSTPALIDLFTLDLHSTEIVLVDCQTLIPENDSGEKRLLTQVGLLYSGAGSIIYPLWKADNGILKGGLLQAGSNLSNLTKSQKFKSAKIYIKKRYPHPYYWAGFQLIGLGD